MDKIIVGEKFIDRKYDFRETCFGICVKDGKFLLVKKKEQYSFIGGGIEEGESHEDCLRREFIEESGYEILDINPFVTIDCFWLAAGKWPLESLANFYIVKVGKKLSEPTEEGHVVEEINIEDAEKLLPLPYHKKALELFVQNL
jgi:8-oxo-dGTP diphosphatase